MKILHIVSSLSSGGAEKQLEYLVNEQSKSEHEVNLIYKDKGSGSVKIPFNLKIFKINNISNYNPRIFFEINSIIKSIKPDIIQSWSRQMDVFVGICAIFNSVNWIPRESNSETPNSRFTLKQILRIVLIKLFATKIVSNSKSGDKFWSKYVKKERREIILNGIPIDDILNTESNNDFDFNLNKYEPFILYVGRLTPHKKVDQIIKSVQKVNLSHDLSALICGVGEPKYERELRELVIKNNLNQKVKFMGFLEQKCVWSLMKKSKAFISISEYEGMPNTVLEAIVCGSNIIASDIPEHQNILDQKHDFLVDPLNIDEISDSIIKILDTSETDQASVNTEKYEDLITQLSIRRLEEDYYKLYKNILN